MSFVSPVTVIPKHVESEELRTFGTLESYEAYIEHQYRDTKALLEKYRAHRTHDPELPAKYRDAMRPIMLTTCWGEAQTTAQVAQIITKTNRPAIQYFYATHALDEVRHTQIEWRRIRDLDLADALEVPYEQTELFRFVNGLPSFVEIVYGQVCTLEAYSAHVLFNSIADLARRFGDLATAVTYDYVMHDEVRHIATGLRVVEEAIASASDPEEARFRILDLEERLLPITIRKLGRDSAIAQSLHDAGMIADTRTFEFDGFRQYLIFRSKIAGLPPIRYRGPDGWTAADTTAAGEAAAASAAQAEKSST
ncbi:MAG: hypothetical protein JOZ24_11980 [Candidatus Eremiobacteraeota bacterium]|nr:hypothetical protein [Candidatus Eremiobacteraeota bacterium]